MIKLGNKIQDIKLGPTDIEKSYLGRVLVFEKAPNIIVDGNNVIFSIEDRISPFTKWIPIPIDVYNLVINKKNIKIKIGHLDYAKVSSINVSSGLCELVLEDSLDTLTGATDWFEKGTKAIITFD